MASSPTAKAPVVVANLSDTAPFADGAGSSDGGNEIDVGLKSESGDADGGALAIVGDNLETGGFGAGEVGAAAVGGLDLGNFFGDGAGD